jgi:hypothetical protein
LSFYILSKKECETTQHLFVDCAFTLDVCGKEKLYTNFLGTWAGSTLADCFNLWSKQNILHPTLSVHICWFIWRERNSTIFEDSVLIVQKVVHRVILAMRDHKVKPITVVRRKGLSCQAVGGSVGWFDGAAASSGHNNGAGGVIKINEQCCFKWFLNCGSGTIQERNYWEHGPSSPWLLDYPYRLFMFRVTLRSSLIG